MSTSIHQALLTATQQLADQHDTASLDAELLLAHVLHKSRAWLYTWPEQELDTNQLEQFHQLVQRRMNGEPVAHLIGTQEFWSLSLQVSPDTLIPRPETERLVELALERIPSDANWRIADLGTGSGAIALAVAKERPACQIIATDKSTAALDIAKENARLNQIANVTFLQGDWLAAVKDEPPFEMILSNPPYIKEDDPHLQQGDVRFDPDSALQAGTEGLDDLQQIIEQALAHLKPGGWLLLEHGYDQRTAVLQSLQQAGFEQFEDYPDLAGQPRVAVSHKSLKR